ncbi:MAG: hypothetical protein EOP42_14480 [Sphingobacteriaceae bacterium]|nr:MAG: hypothetical protein EOP42_14480 [Sphingobacteriaceae bacterium]
MDSYQPLFEQQKKIQLRINQLNSDYQASEKGSEEAIVILAETSLLRMSIIINQMKIIDMHRELLSYQSGEK